MCLIYCWLVWLLLLFGRAKILKCFGFGWKIECRLDLTIFGTWLCIDDRSVFMSALRLQLLWL